MSIYDIEVTKMDGTEVLLKEFLGDVMLIVNTASKCGFTPQFEGLEKLHKRFASEGLKILGFPCNQFLKQDPGSNEEILSFCQINYGVSFEMFQKLDVKGKNQHPLYDYLVNNAKERTGKKIKWNFEKFLIGRNGDVIKRYGPAVKPEDLMLDIFKSLKKSA